MEVSRISKRRISVSQEGEVLGYMDLLNKTNHNIKDGIGFRCLVLLLTILAIATVQNNVRNNAFQSVVIFTSIAVFVLGIAIFFYNGISYSKILFLFSLSLILYLSNFNNFLVVPMCLAVAFVNYPPELIVDAYNTSNIWNLCITIVLALVGLSPMRNVNDGVLSLGYANENTLGLIITFISLKFLKDLASNKNERKKVLKILFIVLSFFVNYFVTQDRTMTLVLLLFTFELFLFKIKGFITLYVYKIVGLILPYFLLYSSWTLAKNFGESQFSYLLNNALSNRLLMWNWYYQKSGISVLPQINLLNKLNYWGTIDGSYTLLLLQYGLMLSIIICTLLTICNLLLLKHKKHTIFYMLLSLEVGAFCENIIQFYTLSFVLVFAINTLYMSWMSNSECLVKQSK